MVKHIAILALLALVLSCEAAIFPAWGPQSGRTRVTVTGSKFIDTEYLSCAFGTIKGVTATYINSSALACISPSYSSPGTVALEVSLNNQDYTNHNVGFWYQPDARVYGLSPSAGFENAAQPVTVIGINFFDSVLLRCKCVILLFRFAVNCCVANRKQRLGLGCTR